MYNTIVTAGRLASDTEIREVSSNKVCKFRMCISSNRSKEPCFIDVEMWGRQAEIAHEHLEKGRLILVQGEIRYSSWENEGKQYQGNQRNLGNPSESKGKRINTHQNSSRNHQASSRISQNHFLIHFATKSDTNNPNGTAAAQPRSTNRSPEPQRRDHARRTH